jgi:hypothetical protein
LVGQGLEDETYEGAYADLRNTAALRLGNYVVIDSVEGAHESVQHGHYQPYEIRGRLFACPSPTGWPTAVSLQGYPATQAPPAYGDRCTTSCSVGQTCDSVRADLDE